MAGTGYAIYKASLHRVKEATSCTNTLLLILQLDVELAVCMQKAFVLLNALHRNFLVMAALIKSIHRLTNCSRLLAFIVSSANTQALCLFTTLERKLL